VREEFGENIVFGAFVDVWAGRSGMKVKEEGSECE